MKFWYCLQSCLVLHCALFERAETPFFFFSPPQGRYFNEKLDIPLLVKDWLQTMYLIISWHCNNLLLLLLTQEAQGTLQSADLYSSRVYTSPLK